MKWYGCKAKNCTCTDVESETCIHMKPPKKFYRVPKTKVPALITREHRLKSYIAKELSTCTYNQVRILFELVNAEMAKRRLKEYSERMKIVKP